MHFTIALYIFGAQSSHFLLSLSWHFLRPTKKYHAYLHFASELFTTLISSTFSCISCVFLVCISRALYSLVLWVDKPLMFFSFLAFYERFWFAFAFSWFVVTSVFWCTLSDLWIFYFFFVNKYFWWKLWFVTFPFCPELFQKPDTVYLKAFGYSALSAWNHLQKDKNVSMLLNIFIEIKIKNLRHGSSFYRMLNFFLSLHVWTKIIDKTNLSTEIATNVKTDAETDTPCTKPLSLQTMLEKGQPAKRRGLKIVYKKVH